LAELHFRIHSFPPVCLVSHVAMSDLEADRKFVLSHEMKIDDAAEAAKNEPNKKKKKDLEGALKKLQADEKYVKALAAIKEAEAQAKRDAERAALQAKDDKKASAKAKTKADAPKTKVTNAKADEATLASIDAAFAAAGKDSGDAKAQAVATLSALAPATPYVLSRLQQLFPLFDNSKLGADAVQAASAIISGITPKGHAVAERVVPLVLAGMEDKKWKIKAGCIEVLQPCLKQMEGTTPAHLALCLPNIVGKLAEAALESRKEIRTATGAVLKEIGGMVASAEIKELSADLVTALAEPTNQKHTQGVLAKMGNATFKSLIDEASLSLLLPIVTRGLKDRESMSKKWSAQIYGSVALLVKDIAFLKPYMKSIIPLLQAGLSDPVPEVQRECAKAFGIMEQVLPEYSRTNNQPWLFNKLRTGEKGEQIGCALAIAQVCLRMEKSRLQELIPEMEMGARDENKKVHAGFLELMDSMPQALKMDFVPYITKLFPPMLLSISGDRETDLGLQAASALVAQFGDLCPELLIDGFEGAYAATVHSKTAEERNRNQATRERIVMLLGKMADKILEHKKFGQDLLTTDCSTKELRERVICLGFIAKSDSDAAVKRVAGAVWKTAGGSPKLQKLVMPVIEKTLLLMRKGGWGAGAQKLACDIIEGLVKSNEMEAPTDEMVEATAGFSFPAPARVSAEAAAIAAGTKSDTTEETQATGELAGEHEIATKAKQIMQEVNGFSALPVDVISHMEAVAACAAIEGQQRKAKGARLTEELAEALGAVLKCAGEAAEAAVNEFNSNLPVAAEKIARATLGDAFDAKDDTAGDAETLLKVENMLLMYGAGHLLLKDTLLELKANRRYGVVGHNGAGKTTLMKEIVNGKIVGMPTHLKCVHVDDSKLGEMSKSCLNSLEYVIKKAKEIQVEDAGKETLLKVGFPENMLEVPVAELSTGWRMRLTLAVSMLKHADIVLLDEPTNHLDEESVEWLGDYILSLTKSSVMVISHEPKFLNKICTNIISYKDKRLVYTEGNFDAFIAAKGIKSEDIEALLSGNLCLDSSAEKNEEDGDSAPKVAAPVAGPPKISFPIAGALEGVKSGSRAVIEIKNLAFRYGKDKDYLFSNVQGKLSLNSRVAICGKNGCGKSTLMTLICSEMSPSENKDGGMGEVARHCNLRMAYMKQDHLKTLAPYFDTSPFVYITSRFKDGWDEELQKRLTEPEDEEEAERRKKLAKEHGKYGNEVETLLSRTKQGSTLMYEVQWKGLNDPKQNTLESINKLRMMGLDKVVIACDERLAAKAAGLDQRPLTRREVVKHCEAFGIDEEMCCNRQIRGFSAGQKVRLSLAAMFWTKPHFIAVDEPTNYLDVETVDALAKALTSFRGGVLMIEPKTEFVERICNETWTIEDGAVTAVKLNNGKKREA